MKKSWIPPRPKTSDGKLRRVGVEIELAGVTADDMVESITECFGGESHWQSPFEIEITKTELGTFKLELDSQLIKRIGKSMGSGSLEGDDNDEKSAEQIALDFISSAAEQLVPWEIVTGPIAVDELEKLTLLVSALRKKGAKGTNYAARYAFGVHLNPELPDLEATTIVDYLRAFFVLYPLILKADDVDISRRITPYINHFGSEYQKLILAEHYAPDIKQLTNDYLDHNPTRNRSLDLLPLLAHIDENAVKSAVDDARIKSRPTFHYRLPNCDIDNAQWNLDVPWQHWMWIERLAANREKLTHICAEFDSEISRITYHLDSQWHHRAQEFLDQHFS